LCFIYFVAFKELLLFLLWKGHVKSTELNIGDILYFTCIGMCLMASFVFRLCFHLTLSFQLPASYLRDRNSCLWKNGEEKFV